MLPGLTNRSPAEVVGLSELCPRRDVAGEKKGVSCKALISGQRSLPKIDLYKAPTFTTPNSLRLQMGRDG